MTTKKKTKKTPEGQKVKKYLPFKLTDQEKAERGEEAAKVAKEAKDLIVKKKIATDELSAQIKERQAKVSNLLTQIDEGTENREVECLEVKNYDENRMEWWVKGKLQHSRDMTTEERQMHLDEVRREKTRTKETTPTPPATTEEQAEREDLQSTYREETSARSAWSTVNGARA